MMHITHKAYVYEERRVRKMLPLSDTGLTILWVVLLGVFLVLEAATTQLVSIWFAVGALAALLAHLFGLNEIWQMALFVLVSGVCLAATRPFVKKLTATKLQKTNADRCIGADAVVTEEINNLKAQGQVKVLGNVWTARAADDAVIPEGTVVTVEKMDGVKLIVRKKDQTK